MAVTVSRTTCAQMKEKIVVTSGACKKPCPSQMPWMRNSKKTDRKAYDAARCSDLASRRGISRVGENRGGKKRKWSRVNDVGHGRIMVIKDRYRRTATVRSSTPVGIGVSRADNRLEYDLVAIAL